jgi:iron complex outermembrane receptor protein
MPTAVKFDEGPSVAAVRRIGTRLGRSIIKEIVPTFGKHSWRKFTIVGLMILAAKGLRAAEPSASPAVPDLSLEELINVRVTSVSRKEEKLNDAAAAVFVLSNDDLRRSGATSVADALRLVPGLQVASIDAGAWAVSARGFNSQFANKLLVMVDGRTVYSPLFSGVYWDTLQVSLDDVERVEVIRGPGATVWGANAVNGVVSILTKSSRDTQGTLIYGGGGDVHLALGGARYGGKIGENTYYRIFGTYQLNRDFRETTGQRVDDGWDLWKEGFRIDHYTAADGQLTWLANGYGGTPSGPTGELYGFNTLGRWSQRLSEQSGYEIQAFVDRTYRNDSLAKVSLDTADLSFQNTVGLGERNDFIWGLGYRYSDARPTQSNIPALQIVDHDVAINLFSAFVQDEIKIVPDTLKFTLGTKLEHNDFTGFEVQPSARLTYLPTDRQTVWAAVSRAVRTPSETEGKQMIRFASGYPLQGPDGGLYVPTRVSNDSVESEVLWAYELGYRVQPQKKISMDVAAFYNDYSHLVSGLPDNFVPGAPIGILEIVPYNQMHGESYGGETVVTVSLTDSWRVSGSYSLLLMHLRGELESDAQAAERNAPTHQVVLRSSYDFTSKLGLDSQLRYVDNVDAIPAYVTADVHLSYKITKNLEVSLVGQNLFDGSHPEQASSIGILTREVPRGFYGKLTWQF